jgi:hypothetical protein
VRFFSVVCCRTNRRRISLYVFFYFLYTTSAHTAVTVDPCFCLPLSLSFSRLYTFNVHLSCIEKNSSHRAGSYYIIKFQLTSKIAGCYSRDGLLFIPPFFFFFRLDLSLCLLTLEMAPVLFGEKKWVVGLGGISSGGAG